MLQSKIGSNTPTSSIAEVQRKSSEIFRNNGAESQRGHEFCRWLASPAASSANGYASQRESKPIAG